MERGVDVSTTTTTEIIVISVHVGMMTTIADTVSSSFPLSHYLRGG